MIPPLSLLLVDADPNGLEMLTYGFEREGSSVNATSDLQAAPKLVGAAAPSLVIVTLRAPEPSGLEVIRRMRTGGYAIPHVAVLVLGPTGQREEARAAGASDFLATPTFIRDVVNAGKLAMVGRRASGQDAAPTKGRLTDYGGLYYLLRAMAAAESSAVLRLERGNRRAELRVSEGRLVSVNVEALQSLPALHHVLLWEEAALSLKLGPVGKRSQLNLSAQEVLDESERFLRDFAHAARDLGARDTLYVPAGDPNGGTPGLQASQAAPLLRLCDGVRVLADVIAESPFRIFDTLRMLKRLRDSGALVARTVPATENAPPAEHNGAPRSMLGEWAMVPDQRGVVGNRRSANRPARPSGSGTGPTPLPLVNKKGASTAGEIVPARRPTPAGIDLGSAATIQVKLDAHGVPATIQVKLDAHGMPLSAPLAVGSTLAFPTEPPLTVARAPGQKTPILLRTRADNAARAQLDRTPAPEVRRSPTGPQPRLERTPPPRLGRSPTGPQPRLERTPPPRLGRSPTGPQPRLERTPPPRLEKFPTGPQPHLERTPPPRLEKFPTGPQPRLERTPPPRLEKSPTGPQPRLERTPPPRLEKFPTGPQPRLERTPPPRLEKSPTGPQPTLDDAPAPLAERAPTEPQPTLDDAPAPLAERAPTGPQPTLDDAPAPLAERAPTEPQPKLDGTPAPRLIKPLSGPHQTPAATFDDLESDFFAREADLYKREALETFDDLDHPLGRAPSAPRSGGKPRARKK